MNKKFLLTMMLISPIIAASTEEVKAMERDCREQCWNIFSPENQACMAAFKVTPDHNIYRKCVKEASDNLKNCNNKCEQH